MFSQKFLFISLITLSLSYSKITAQSLTSNSSLINEPIQISNDLLDTHTRSVNCFDVYMEKMNKISEKFQKDTQECITIAEEAHNEAEKQTLGQQKDLKDKTKESCNAILNCRDLDSGIEDIECYSAKVRKLFFIKCTFSF